MAINGLLVASGGAMLCLHGHNFGHLVVSEKHAGHGEDCHGHEGAGEHTHRHDDGSDHEESMEAAPHCFDIVMKSSDEPIRRVSDLFSVKKPVAVSYHYEYFEPASVGIASPKIRLASRAPPDLCGALEQCVRKTVLRI